MSVSTQPCHLLVIALAGWINRDQQAFIDYLIEQNHVLKDQLEGRPGWPIEGSVMIDQYLEQTIDIYGGGQDLISLGKSNFSERGA